MQRQILVLLWASALVTACIGASTIDALDDTTPMMPDAGSSVPTTPADTSRVDEFNRRLRQGLENARSLRILINNFRKVAFEMAQQLSALDRQVSRYSPI